MKVLIGGSGIAGLAASIATALQGHEVEVFEEGATVSTVSRNVCSECLTLSCDTENW